MFKMCQISQMICMISLGALAISDWKTRSVPLIYLEILEFLAAGYIFVRKEGFLLFIGGILIGGIFLLFSFLTREAIGYGDSMTILVMGTYLGIWNLMMFLLIAFTMAAVCSLIRVMLKKMSQKDTLAFLPFLEAAYLMMLVSGL